MNNVIRTDSYKFSHYLQTVPGMTHQHSYIESRGGEFDKTVFFGLQMYLHKLAVPITQADIDDAEPDVLAHGEPFNRAGWQHILDQHGGHLPLIIRAAAEGSVIPTHNALVTIENTDPACAWLPSFVETGLLRAVWYPTTVASLSFASKVEILQARMATCDDPVAGLEFCLHDFGSRGVSSGESAAIGAAAHLVNFLGSDTFECLRPIREIYGERMAGFSIPAAEHSTITSWRNGIETHEHDAYANMLDRFAKPGAIVAVVSDSYDLWAAISNIWGGSLKQRVIESGARIVLRPDSGNPTTVPVQAVEALAAKFGYTINRKGFKVLPDCVRVIQGDGITQVTIRVILDNLMAAGYAAENLVFGMGGGLLQQVNRDTLRFAMKASACCVNGVWRDVYKNPIDDPSKRSKAGRLALIGPEHATVRLEGHEADNLLLPVFENGRILTAPSFTDIRQRAHQAALAAAGLRIH